MAVDAKDVGGPNEENGVSNPKTIASKGDSIGNVLPPALESESKLKDATLVASTPSSVQSGSDHEDAPIISATPRPSITAAIRRGSFYGDATPRASIADVLAAHPNDPSITTESASSVPESDVTSVVSEIEEEQLIGRSRVYVMGFLHGTLERLDLMAMLPGANSRKDTSLNLADFSDGLPELAMKTKLLNSASLVKYNVGVPSKLSKFALEVAYFIKVMACTLKEVEDCGTIHQLVNLIEEDNLRIKRLPDCIAHIKQLKDSMEMLTIMIEAEAQAHKEAMRQWAKNIVERKLELKELRKQNMIRYRYQADTALAKGDLSRRVHEVELVHLRAENVRLKNDLEVEKKVFDFSVEFLKKQNIELREEAVALQAGIENDTHNLDHMLEKMRIQNKEKETILAELEPRYLARMAEIEAARLEAIRKQEEFFANQGQIELQTFAALKIQRIWRGYLVRKVWRKVLKKLKRKRLAAKKKGGVAKKSTKKKK